MYNEAVSFVRMQDRNIKKVNGLKFVLGEYEYRLTYEGGFSAFVRIDRREIGKRRFIYFSGFGAYDCLSVGSVLEKARGLIGS